jgi:calcineurin-like phosphoesterase
MCGDYDSVLGMIKRPAVERFIRKVPTERLEPAPGEATLCAVWLEVYNGSGLARRIDCLRSGGRLSQAWPVETGNAKSRGRRMLP